MEKIIYLVIPAYEPDDRLIELLIDLKKYSSLHIIVVNDGSGEKYNNIFEKAKLYATVVLNHEVNKGKGEALKTAYTYIQNLNEPGVVVTADSDGQHTPDDIMKIANKCKNKPDAIITGVRCFKGKVPLKSKLGNNITKDIFFLTTGVYLEDTQCGLRAFSTTLLSFMLNIKGSRFEYEMNVLLEAARKIPIEMVQIETIYIDNNSGTHFKPVKDAYMIYKKIIKFAMSSIMSFVVDYIAYVILINLLISANENIKIVLANVIARIISATFNYILNKRYVFNDNQKYTKTAWKYVCLAICVLITNTGLLLVLNKLGLGNLYIIKIIVEVILFILNFFVQKMVVFR